MAASMAKLCREDELVRKISQGFRGFGDRSIQIGTGDDAAIWEPRKGQETILTSDWFLESTHFLREKHPPDSVGWKSLARAVSDVAAMGGTPRCFLLNVALPSASDRGWLDDFLGGLRRASRVLRCSLAGGDTTRQDRILINITVIGEVVAGQAVLRSGARKGNMLFVSGTLGEAELGLRQLRKSRGKVRATNAPLSKHLYPEPRVALGKWLAKNRLVTAMMDISDGLSTDLARLCEASGVGALIEESALPISQGVRRSEALRFALHGGDDYELLFTASPTQANRLRTNYRGLPITCIGKITTPKKLLLAKNDGRQEVLSPRGWDPFRK